MEHLLQRAYLALAIVGVGGFLVVPDGSLVQTVWQVAIGWLAAAAIIVGVRRHRPAAPAAWWLIAVGVAGNASGIAVEAILTATQPELTFPSLADAAYLSLYPAAAAGLIVLIRRRAAQRNWSTLVDTTTLTTGISLLAWIFMVRPAASDPSVGLLGHIVSVAYPVGDIVLLAMTVRLMLDGIARNRAFVALLAALMAFLGGDSAWALIMQMSWETGPMANKALA